MEMNVLTFQVTTEKVKALMELAQLKQDYQLLQEYDSLFLFPLNYQFDLMLCKFHVGANIFFLIYFSPSCFVFVNEWTFTFFIDNTVSVKL